VLHCLFDEHGADGRVAYVAHQGKSADADGFNLLLRCRRNGAGAVDGNTGPGLRKRDGDGGAEAARGTRNQGSFAFEAELVEN
jgi:hypothetical protein